jgi:antitoxin (DNA-binding transcriptional repressor) of toxin-antitoxin stability system
VPGGAGIDTPTKPDQNWIVKVVNIQEAKTHLSRLIDAAAGGECVLLAEHGNPLAKLFPDCPERETRVLGNMEEVIRIPPNFDDEDPRIQALFA